MNKTIALNTSLSLVITCAISLTPAVVANENSAKSWTDVPTKVANKVDASTPAVRHSAESNDGWVNVPSSEQASFKSRTYSPLEDRNDVGLSDLQASHEAPAEPLILDFGLKGSDVAQEVIQDNQLLQADTSEEPSIINLDMFVGQLKVLGKVDVTRVAIGNGSIIRAEVLKTGELLIIGQQEGSTSLRLWNKDEGETQTAYNIRVGASDPETRIRMERTVQLRVRMVEFNKRAIRRVGIDWATEGINGPTLAVAGDAIGNNLFRPPAEGFSGLPNTVDPFSTYFGIATNITSTLNFLASSGDAVTLAEPVLSAMNGGQASFLAGGEIPFPTTGSNGETNIEFKEYGVRLQVAPRIDAGGNIRTLVETEISSIDAAVSINGTPGLLTRRAQTEVNVRSGETIVVAGLLTSDESNDNSGIPGLRNLPIIGGFFRTESKINEVRELVIFITPEVIDPNALLNTRDRDTFERSNRRVETSRLSLPLME